MSIKVPDGWKTKELETVFTRIGQISRTPLEEAVMGVLQYELRSQWFKSHREIDEFLAKPRAAQTQVI